MKKNIDLYLTREEKKISAILTLSIMLTIFFADLYVPALPTIAKSLDSSKAILQFSVGFYFLGLSLSQLVFGPLSDRYGRRFVMLLGFSITLIGSLISMFMVDSSQLLLGRFIQSIGMGAPGCLGRIALRDMLEQDIKFARAGSYMGAIVLLAPAVAPAIGAYIQVLFGWRADFIFLMLINLLALFLVWKYLPETNKKLTDKLHLVEIAKKYKIVLKNRIFLGYAICTSALLAGLITYLAISSFLFQKQLGFSTTEYSRVFILTTIALVISMLLNARFLTKLGLKGAIKLGLGLMGIGTCIMIYAWLTHQLDAPHILTAVFLFCLSTGFIFANASSASFKPFKSDYGIVGALFSSIRTILAAIVAMTAGLAEVHALGILTTVYVFSTVIALTSFFWLCQGGKTLKIADK